jgi:hypothetical protein
VVLVWNASAALMTEDTNEVGIFDDQAIAATHTPRYALQTNCSGGLRPCNIAFLPVTEVAI